MNGSYSYLFVKAILTLGFMLGFLLVSVYALRIYTNKRTVTGKDGAKRPGNASPVKVLHTSALGSKKNLAIVDVAGEVLVLGITPSSINMLAKIEALDAIEDLKKLNSARRPFFSLLQGGL